MEHTTAFEKKNRNRILGMIAHFGLSSVMFTVSPDDRMNLQIRVYTRPRKDVKLPDLTNNNTNAHTLLTNFVIDC